MLRTAILALATSSLLLTACKQGLDERCQVQSDCQDGLLCVYPAGGSPQTGGVCQSSAIGTDMAAAIDFATDVDLASTVDLAGTVDLSTHD